MEKIDLRALCFRPVREPKIPCSICHRDHVSVKQVCLTGEEAKRLDLHGHHYFCYECLQFAGLEK